MEEHRQRYLEAFDQFSGPAFAVRAWAGPQYLSGFAGRGGDVFEIRAKFRTRGGVASAQGEVISGLTVADVSPWDRTLGLLALKSLMAESRGPLEGDVELRYQERLTALRAQPLESVGLEVDGVSYAARHLTVPQLPMWAVHTDLDASSVAVIGENLEVSTVTLERIVDPTKFLA